MREQVDAKIMRTVLEIITTQGVGAVSIEAVSRQSGVAKTTIYRRYKNADDLLQHLASVLSNPVDFSALEPSPSTLRTVLQTMVNSFDEKLGLTAVGMVLSSHNEHLTTIAHKVIQPVAQQFHEFIQRGRAAGTVRSGVDTAFLFQTILGSMIATKALGNHHHDWVTQMSDLLTPQLFA